MRAKDSFFEQDIHEMDLNVDKILEDAYQRCGETEGIKGTEQDELI